MDPATSEQDRGPDATPRQPRYPIEEPLQERSQENDEKALELASRALAAWEKRRARNDNGNSDESSPKVGPVRLDSIYGDSRDWPKKGKSLGIKGAVQYSWSNIGFPNDPKLAVQDLEDRTDIDKDDLNITALAQDALDVKNRNAEDIADRGTLHTETDNGRTIELFKLKDRRIAKVIIEGADAKQRGVNYKRLKAAKAFGKILDKEYQIKKPSLNAEHLVASHVLLCRGGQTGGKAADYWKTARNLAQQHIYLDQGLEARLQSHLNDVKTDMAFIRMLETVKKCIKQNAFNPYYQASRDDFAVEKKLFRHIKDVDLIMILDTKGSIIMFQCSDAIRKLFNKSIEKAITTDLENFSTGQAVPTPDMTRHGLHYAQWLIERPDLDFRLPSNDPRLAKSGVYHFGVRFPIGDPDGEGTGTKTGGPCHTRDMRSRLEETCEHDFHKLRFGALGACTEAVSFFFRLLEPEMFAEYITIVEQVLGFSKFQFETRKTQEPFAMRALLINLMTNEHKDSGDWQCGLAALTAFGSFEGGDLLLGDLGLQIEAPPGCVQLIRGRELRHSISKYSGRRFVVVHTNHEAVRRWARRRMGLPITDIGTTPLDSCLEKNQEDYVPEDSYVESSREMFPERYVTTSDEGSVDSEASVPKISRSRPKSEKRLKTASSSDASAEKSEDGSHDNCSKRRV
ncbi:hypothetical protein Daus18300_014018 [Diaporthe australafricana]|uniref:Uncharacterized protein n=1 Tax=Diaporthe australafricana TaxID=127596 RepID=A0ABR3VWU0_9PEZI